MRNVINTTPIQFTDAAWGNLEECGVNVDQDLSTIRRKGPGYASDFLAWCLNGADADREQGWRDYVDALFDHAFCSHDDEGDDDEAERVLEQDRALARRMRDEGVAAEPEAVLDRLRAEER